MCVSMHTHSEASEGKRGRLNSFGFLIGLTDLKGMLWEGQAVGWYLGYFCHGVS